MTEPSARARIGLLNIDALDEPFRSLGGDYPDRYRQRFSDAGAELVVYDARNDPLPDHGECDGWVVPGSRESVYDDSLAWLAALKVWIAEALEARVPLLGVCFGHQLIGQILGAEVAKADDGWNIGAIDYEITHMPDWLVGTAADPGSEPSAAGPGRFRLLASHQDQVLDLPPGAELVATTPTCPVAAFTVADHVLCVQGHPEFDPVVVEPLYRSRTERIGADQVNAAIETLDRPLDNDLVVAWMVATVEHAGATR